jgi:hypothetical protein
MPGQMGQMPGMGGMPQQSGLAPQGSGGYQQANPMQKTIVAGMAPPIVGGQMQGMPGGMPGMQPPGMGGMPGTMPGGMMQPPGGLPGMGGMQPPGAPQKTVMLQPSEGVVSVARTGGALAPANTGGGMMQQGASTAFWIVSLLIGLAVGVLGYVIVRQL